MIDIRPTAADSAQSLTMPVAANNTFNRGEHSVVQNWSPMRRFFRPPSLSSRAPPTSPSFILLQQLAWDIFVAVVIVYECIEIPLRIGFDLDSTDGQIVVDAVIDFIFFVDMVLSFRTAYIADDGEVVAEPSDIAWRYLKGTSHLSQYVVG